jgi:gliding motility-associated-like protein
MDLCPGNTLRISAGNGYASYQWQDGSGDSMYIVSQPGIYYVKTVDACGGVFTDTIRINPGLPVSLDIGPDLVICRDDTVRITAPSGFVSYKWFPYYHISSDTTQSITIHSKTDTVYYIKAEKTPGCFAFDTLKITVKQSVSINLGSDTSFCEGDSLLLVAGNGFDQYKWNTGSQGSQIAVYQQGIYSITATAHNGCSSYDTLKIINVWNIPKVDLYRDSTICFGTTVMLSPGQFNSYLWEDGSTAGTRKITTPGTYSVLVEDKNGCQGSGTTRITNLLPPPSQFLTSDTSLCTYAELELKAAGTFKDYQWSNGVSQSRITIKQPGRYWLKVTDYNNCKGTDTINITQKDCLQGFYIPSAFTPDRDQRNDDFKPLLFGKIIHYQFTVYNRWGEMVFTSKKAGLGWDGTVRGIVQNTGTFVWTCTYQLEGESRQVRKGTCMLIR